MELQTVVVAREADPLAHNASTTMRRFAATTFALLAVCGSGAPTSAQRLPRVRVPAVVGLSERAALASVRRAGLVPRVTFGTSATIRRGFVFAQVPAGTVYVARGSRVEIAVSRGTPRVAVPDVVGDTFSHAVVRLRAVGLRPWLQNVVPSTRPADTVLAQTPEPGTMAVRNSAVALAVSGG